MAWDHYLKHRPLRDEKTDTALGFDQDSNGNIIRDPVTGKPQSSCCGRSASIRSVGIEEFTDLGPGLALTFRFMQVGTWFFFSAMILSSIGSIVQLSNPTNIARASALGCFEFIQKTSPIEKLVTALLSAAAGQPTPPTSLLSTTKTRMKRIGSGPAESPLTKRESQVLQHVAMGLSNREIGKSLGISVETVKEHVQNILRKLDVNDRTQAAVWALKNGMI